MKRLAILWLACAAIGFLAAIGAALVLSLALDGDDASRGAQPAPRLVDRKAPAAPSKAPQPQSYLASVVGSPG